MADFFDDLPLDAATDLERLTRLAYDAREARAALLKSHGAADEPALAARIAAGGIAEHPAWEHLVAARVLEAVREAARTAAAAALDGIAGRASAPAEAPDAPLPTELAAAIDARFASRLAAPCAPKLDALLVHLPGGLELEARFADAATWSMRWRRDGREAGLDTAPVHGGLATAPRHLHTADGDVAADLLTAADEAPEERLARVVEALLADPSLGL